MTLPNVDMNLLDQPTLEKYKLKSWIIHRVFCCCMVQTVSAHTADWR